MLPIDKDILDSLILILEPYMVDGSERRTMVEAALHGCRVLTQIDWTGSAHTFTVNLVRTLLRYGDCAPSHPATVMLLDSIKQQAGVNTQREIAELQKKINPLSDSAEYYPHLSNGTLIGGRYRLINRIGDESGQAQVWQAQDTRLLEVPPVVVKCIKPHTSRDYTARFLEEILSVRELHDHPHIITIYDFGIEGGLCYIVMPTLGSSLRGRLKQVVRLSPDEALNYLDQIAQALDFAHQNKIIHRDLKPANILFKRDTNQVCLADFGISYRANRANSITATRLG